MDPRDVREEAQEEIEERLLMASGYPPGEVPEVFEELSELFEAFAISHLLERADQEAFRLNLVRAAQARRHFLGNSSADTDDLHFALSRSDGLFQALAAGNLALAVEISELSTDLWLPTREYEEDFLYRSILGSLTINTGFLAGGGGEMLGRFAEVLGGDTSPRLALAESFAKADPIGFRAALVALIEERQGAIDARRPDVVESDFLFWASSYVFVESLALLRIGELLGLSLEEDLPLCPRESRLPISMVEDADLFEEVAKVRRGRGV